MQQGEARYEVLAVYRLLFTYVQSRSETSRAHLHLFGLSFNVNSHGLEVRVPAPFRFIVSMTYIIACNRSLTTYFTHLRHAVISLIFVCSCGCSFVLGLLT
jgi:hypothetical protein